MVLDDVNTELLKELKQATLINEHILLFQRPIDVTDGPIQGVYIRQCYRRLLELITEAESTSKCINIRPSVLVLSDPGMGKTFFTFYLIHYLLSTVEFKDTANIVFDYVENKYTYFYEAATGTIGHTDDAVQVEHLLRSNATWYIVDGCQPKMPSRNIRARVVLLCSFRKHNYFSYEKFFLVNR